MAETLNRASDIKRMTGKYIGDEEPIVVAQRFLNIFRQLHIFNAERKDAFNNMILELPSELRGMFGALPGGSVLQEYVDDLEQKSGIKREKTNINLGSATNSSQLNEELSKARILATALAEAQAQTAANMQQIRPAAPIYVTQTKEQRIAELKSEMNLAKKNNDTAKIKELHQAYTDLQNENESTSNYASAPVQNMGVSGPIKIVADADFAKEIASAFVNAMQFSEKQRHTETSEITNAIRESQVEMAKILKEQKETIVDNIAMAPTDHNFELLTKSDAKEITQAIKDSQIEIAKIFAQSQKNIPVITSNGATEIVSRSDNSDIAQAIKDSQLEVAKMLMQHNAISASTSNNANANNIQINNSPTFPPVEEFMNGIVKAQMEMFKEVSKVQTQELSSIISLALKESQQLSTQTIIEAVTALQKENAKLFEMQIQKPQVIVQERIIHEKAPQSVEASSLKEVEESDEDEELSADALISSAPETIEEPVVKAKKKKKKKNKNKNNAENNIFFGDANKDKEFVFGEENTNTTETENTDWVLEYEDEKNLNNNGLLDISLFDTTDNNLGSNVVKADQKLDDLIFDIDNIEQDNSLPAKDNKEDNDFAWLDDNKAHSTDNDDDLDWNEIEEQIDTISPSKESKETNIEATSEDDDWEWEEVEEEIKTPEANVEVLEDEPETIIEASTEDDDWEWEEVEEETKTPEAIVEVLEDEPETIIEASTEDDDWEWEEVEEETKIPEVTVEVLEDELETIIEASAEDDDWEWEEVEEETKIPEVTVEVLEEEPESIIKTSAEDNEEGEEWEWEYEEEEVQNDSSIIPVLASSDASVDSEEEWEWEYEEDTVDLSSQTTSENATNESIATDNEESEEWEWEYEEDTSSNEAVIASSETENASNNTEDDEEWEWEYEEELPEETSTILTPASEVSITSPNLEADPYKNDYVLSTENETNQNEDVAQIYTGDLYFQKDVCANNDKPKEIKITSEIINPEITISELSDSEDNNEPYLKNNDIK